MSVESDLADGRADHAKAVERSPEHERRRARPRVRTSWASPVPFALQEGVNVHQVAKDAVARRGSWIGPLLRRLVATDAVVATLVMAACLYSLPATRGETVPYALLAGLLWVLLLTLLGGYDSRRLGDGPEEFEKIGQAAVLAIALLGVVSYALQLVLPRRDVLVAVPVIALTTVLGRYVWRRWLHRRRRDGAAMLRTIVVGEPAAVADVVDHLRRDAHHGLDVVGACTPVGGVDAFRLGGVEPLGVVSEVPQVVVDNAIDNVVVVGSQITGGSLRRLSWALEQTGADLMVAPGLVEVTGAYVSLHPAAGLSLLRVEKPAQSSGRLLIKSVQDRIIGTVLFLVALPVIAVAAVAVRLTSPGKAFFAQARVGQDGERFTMWKLRSMVPDAERLRNDLLDQSDRDGLMFKMRGDPRVTPVGRVLRRYSVDELPQLWNVVRGDMSLVGPRPPLPHEYAQYHDQVHRRLRVKPGLTGLWQVSGRADLSWEESVRLDLRYVDNWSPAMDLQILWKTFRAVMSGSGAY
ncbi:sugar transferase [Aquipuribacter sp. MA13-6]|uniref:sugar transferase n=1 Tax=unclassified Aquipuribacter TaxID=2635084 RepID=UPI003EEF64B7